MPNGYRAANHRGTGTADWLPVTRDGSEILFCEKKMQKWAASDVVRPQYAVVIRSKQYDTLEIFKTSETGKFHCSNCNHDYDLIASESYQQNV